MKPIKLSLRWSDLDPNHHITSTTYADLFIEARLYHFAQSGFNIESFSQHGIGPVVIHEHFYYVKELNIKGDVYVDFFVKGMSTDLKYFQIVQHLYTNTGELSCYSEVTFSWIDMKTRKLTPPPSIIQEGLKRMPKTEDFEHIDSSVLKNSKVPYKKTINISV